MIAPAHPVESPSHQETGDSKALKSAAAKMLGRIGGLKGGKARAAKLTPQERTRIAVIAAETRWKDKPWKK